MEIMSCLGCFLLAPNSEEFFFLFLILCTFPTILYIIARLALVVIKNKSVGIRLINHILRTSD